MKKETTQVEDGWFKALHQANNPLVLYNIWNIWSAKIAEKTEAKALATSSRAVAEAHGYEDGEKLPFKLALENLHDIIKNVKTPVSFDFESGFAVELATLKANVIKVIEAGAIGINFEDQIIGKNKERYSIEEQCKRIKIIKETIEKSSLPHMFINARTDIFLQKELLEHNTEDLKEAIERGRAYAKAGAEGFFTPGLINPVFIKQLCKNLPIPVNIMVSNVIEANSLKGLGVSRISYGPFPYYAAEQEFKNSIIEALAFNDKKEI